jgi:hypothetical protein
MYGYMIAEHLFALLRKACILTISKHPSFPEPCVTLTQPPFQTGIYCRDSFTLSVQIVLKYGFHWIDGAARPSLDGRMAMIPLLWDLEFIPKSSRLYELNVGGTFEAWASVMYADSTRIPPSTGVESFTELVESSSSPLPTTENERPPIRKPQQEQGTREWREQVESILEPWLQDQAWRVGN